MQPYVSLAAALCDFATTSFSLVTIPRKFLYAVLFYSHFVTFSPNVVCLLLCLFDFMLWTTKSALCKESQSGN